MSIVSVKDFGDALNISGGTIRSKISRKQLLRNKKGFIDTENPTNYIYLLEVNGGDQSVFEEYHQGVISKSKVIKKSIDANKSLQNVVSASKKVILVGKPISISEKSKIDKLNKIKGSVNIAPVVETKKIPEKKVVEKLSVEEKREKEVERKARISFLDMEVRKKQADLSVVERNAEIKQMQLEKIAGNTLPLDITKTLLKVNLQSIMKTFKAELENIATISVEILGGTREDLVRITNEQDLILSKLIKIAKSNADSEIERIVNEYSEVRSRGERK